MLVVRQVLVLLLVIESQILVLVLGSLVFQGLVLVLVLVLVAPVLVNIIA